MVLRLVTQIVALCGVGVAAIARKSALAQLRVLLVKSLLYLGPALLLLALWLATPSSFEGTVNTVETTTDWTTRLPRCINGTRVSEPCTTLLYSPASVESVELVMRRLALQNELEFGRDVVGTSMNETQLQQYVLAHPNTTQGAVIFTTASSIEHPDEWHRELGTPDIRYQMDNRLLVMQLAVDRALASLLADESTEARNNDYASSRSSRAIPLSMAIRFKSSESSLSFSVMSFIGPQLVTLVSFMVAALWFVALSMQISNEKDSGMRGYLSVMGLLDSAWWIAATITSWLPYMIGAVAVMLVGQLLALPVFTKCQASVTLVVFAALGSSHFGLYTLVGSIIDSKRASLLVAVGIYVFEMLLAWSLLSFGPVALSFSLVPSVLVPGFVQALLCAALVLQTVGSRFSQDPDISPPGVSWSSISSNPTEYYQSIGISKPDAVPTIATMLLINVALGTACFLLALYFDNVLERLDRPAQHWLYFVTPRYWGLGCGATSSTTSDQASAASATSVEMRDPDPDLDAEISQAHDPNAELSLRVVGVSHTYRRSSIVSWLASWSPLRNCCSSLKRGDTRALTDLHLTAGSGSIVCLLGANGSAKSTTVRIISGALTPTSGSVFVNGLSVRENAAAIRQSLGVCPQFDVLWPDLCALDHIYVLGLIKLARLVPRQQAMDLLTRVGLSKAALRPAWEYSGGMKRSLSVAMCTLGEPKVLLLDEPTSGMDPKTRRHLWNFILSLKHERLILLTTHSMEEADALGEKIAIMRNGSLRCVGTPQHLKARFGNGYQLTVHAQEYAAPTVIYQVQQHVPGATLGSAHGGALTFRLPQQELPRFSALFAHLKRASTGRGAEIIRWGISNATLEAVFLNVQ